MKFFFLFLFPLFIFYPVDTYELEWLRLNGEFSRNLKILGNRIVINPYVDEMDSGTYKCIAYYDEDAYSSSDTIIIKRINSTEPINESNLLRPKLKPNIALLPNLDKDFHYDTFVKVDCNNSIVVKDDSQSVEWIRLQNNMSERVFVNGSCLIINKYIKKLVLSC